MNQQEQQRTSIDDRGPGARKVELERRLDANAELEGRHLQAGDDARRSNTPRKAGATKAETPERPPASRERDAAEARAQEAQLDEALRESFPASDPPAHSTPTRTGPAP